MQKMRNATIAITLAAGSAFAISGPASALTCEMSRPVVFADLDWDSALFHNQVARFILEKGYGCKTDAIPGSSVPLLGGVARGDIDIVMELWTNTLPKVWMDGLNKGKVKEFGANYEDGFHRWFVPRYMVEGNDAPAKGLKSVTDIPRFKDQFKDPEEPGKGRFYNCIPGWQCEITNTKKFYAYGLDKDFVNFRPGTGAAVTAAVESALKRKRPIFFYHWGPSWLYGKYKNELVALEEPPFDKAVWDELEAAKNPQDVKKATAYPSVIVAMGANSAFAEKAPELVKFLSKYHTSGLLVSEALVYMKDNGGSAEKAARNFLKTHEDVWTKWVPKDVAVRVRGALIER